MAFTGVAAYPSAVTGEDASAKKLTDTEPALNTTTTAGFGTTTTRRNIQWKPLTSNTTAAVPSTTATGFGWHILKAEMNRSANLPARAKISAGAWSFTVEFATSGADATGGAAVIEAWVYRRSAAGAYAFLFSAVSAGVSIALSGTKTATFSSVAQPAIILATDETIHVELWCGAQGVALTGNTYTLRLGLTGATFPLVSGQGPGILSDYPRSHTATLSLTGLRKSVILPGPMISALSVAATFTRALVSNRAFIAALSLSALTTKRASLNPKVATLSLAASAIRRLALGRAFTVALSLAATLSKRTITKAFTAPLALAGAFSRSVVTSRAFTVALTLGTAFSRAVISARAFTTSLTLAAAMARSLALGRAFTAALSLAGALGKRTITKTFNAPLVLTGVFSRRTAASRAFTVALALDTGFARAVISARTFTTSLTLTAKGRVQMAFEVLNRIVGGGGGTTIVKKIFHIFDD